MDNIQRVAIFIDNSNVFRNLCDLHKTDPKWIKKYDPLALSRKLVGNRELVSVNFYCAPPPPYLQNDGREGNRKYWSQMNYYESVKKLPLVNFKLGYLNGSRENLCEKNVDTQIVTDMLVMAGQNKYDTVILCSNDGDFQSAVSAVKDMGKKVEVMFFKNMCSYALIKSCDVSRKARISFFEEIGFSDTAQPTLNI